MNSSSLAGSKSDLYSSESICDYYKTQYWFNRLYLRNIIKGGCEMRSGIEKADDLDLYLLPLN